MLPPLVHDGYIMCSRIGLYVCALSVCLRRYMLRIGVFSYNIYYRNKFMNRFPLIGKKVFLSSNFESVKCGYFAEMKIICYLVNVCFE